MRLAGNYFSAVSSGKQPLGIIAYLPEWFSALVSTTFGIKAFIWMVNPTIIGLFSFLMLVSLIAFLIGCKKGLRKESLHLAIIAFAYMLFLYVYINYPAYLYYRHKGMSVSGRYVFPVLAPVYALSLYYLINLFKNKQLRIAIAVAVSFLFIISDFPAFLMQATSDWYAPFY